MLFAQLQTVPGEEIKNFALILLAILGGAYYAKGIFTRSQKREVTFEAEFARKEEFDRQVNQNQVEHAQLHQKIGGVERGANSRMNELSGEWRKFADSKFAELMTSNERGRDKLHDRVNEVLGAVSELRGIVTEMRKKP